ncbi:MAG: AAA family ATPase [Kyrpidia tusciae]|nr:AAA family ATPase [Kyrpidia tusciae]MBE3552503.1 AAA family ATPase [Kyrpidia tusciae]
MRILGWRVDRYGRWHDLERTVAPSGLIVLFGLNEAGKTTWLHFIRAMLFGESRKDKSPYWSPEVGWSGRLDVGFADGQQWRLERRVEGRREYSRIVAPGGAQVDEETWNRRMGGLSRFVYDQIFAFGLGELERFESLSDPRVAGQLYSAGAGLRGTDLAAAEQRLVQAMEKRYKSRGKNPVINQLQTALQECERQIRLLGDPAAEYAEVTAALAQCDDEEAEIAGCRKEVRARRRRLLRLKQLREIFDAWETTESSWAEVRDLPDVDPEELARLERALERVAELRLEADRAAKEREALDAELRSVPEPGPLWRERERIATVLEGRGLEAGRREERIRVRSELASLAVEERDWVQRLGPELVGKGAEPDTSIAAREHGSELWRALEQAEVASRDRRATVEREVQVLERIRQERLELEVEAKAGEGDEVSSSGAAANGSGPALTGGKSREGDIRSRRAKVRELLETRRQRAEKEARLESTLEAIRSASNSQAGPERWAWAIPAAGLMFIALVGGLFGAHSVLVWGAAIVGAAMAVWGVSRGRRAERDAKARREAWERRKSEIESHIRDLTEREARMAESLFGRADWSERDIEDIEGALDDAARRMALVEEKRARIEQLRRDEERARRTAEMEQKKLQESEDQLVRTRESWESWLAAQGLPRELSWPQASAALDAFDHLRRLRGQMAERRRREADLADQGQRWRRQLAELCAQCGLPIPSLPEDEDLGAQADWDARVCGSLRAALDDEIGRVQRRDRLRDERKKAVGVAEQTFDRLAAAQGELQRGWADLGITGEEEWRKIRTELRRRRELRDARRALEEQLHRLAGDERELAEVAHWDLVAIEDELTELDRMEEELDRKTRDIGARRAENTARLKELEEGRSLSHWLQLREDLMARLRREVQEWAVDALALHLLRRTKERYERDRQPAVIRRASTAFAALTGGRYRRIVVPLEEEAWYAEDVTGHRWPLPGLSRGTTEQMYLAIRLGLIDDLRERGVVPPVVMDDILVNFDPVRRRQGAALLVRLAEDVQLFYLTCHPEVVEDFQRASSQVEVVDLKGWDPGVQVSGEVRHG